MTEKLCDCYAVSVAGPHQEEEHDTDGGRLDRLHSEAVTEASYDKTKWILPSPKTGSMLVPSEKERHIGTVKFWVGPPKSYGFLIPDDKSLKEVHVWYKNIDPSTNPMRLLVEGQRVEFGIDDNNGRPRAIRVVLLPEQSLETERLFILATKAAISRSDV